MRSGRIVGELNCELKRVKTLLCRMSCTSKIYMSDENAVKATLGPADKRRKIWTCHEYEDSICYHTPSMLLFTELLPDTQCQLQNINTTYSNKGLTREL